MQYISKYDNPELFKVLSYEEKKEDGFFYKIQELLDLTTQKKIKRTLKYNDYSNSNININNDPYLCKNNIRKNSYSSVNARKKWKKFGLGLEDEKSNKNSNIGEDVFMEYTPAILKSQKSSQYISDILSGKKKFENIKIIEGEEEDFHQHIYDLSKKIPKEELNEYAMKCLYYDHIKIEKPVFLPKPGSKHKQNNGVSELKTIKPQKTTYIAPHLRNRKSKGEDSSDSNEKQKYHKNKEEVPLEEKKSIRLSNITIESEEELIEWLKPMRLGKYKVFIPKDKKTQKCKDFALINFSFHRTAVKALEVLDKQRMGYNIITVEWSKY